MQLLLLGLKELFASSRLPQRRAGHFANLSAAVHRAFRWSGQRGSNPRPQAWEACTLPTELHPPSGSYCKPINILTLINLSSTINSQTDKSQRLITPQNSLIEFHEKHIIIQYLLSAFCYCSNCHGNCFFRSACDMPFWLLCFTIRDDVPRV